MSGVWLDGSATPPRSFPSSSAEIGTSTLHHASVPPALPVQSGRSGGPLSALRPPVPGSANQPPPPSPLPPAPARVSSGARAVASLLDGVDRGEGVRIGLLGDTGTGKSYLARAIVAEYLRRTPGPVLVADSKAEGGWAPEVRESLADYAADPPTGRLVALQPNLFRGEGLDLEQIARWQWALAARGHGSLVVYDELTAGCHRRQSVTWARDTTALPRIFTQGRRPRISALWGAQFAQQVPHEPFEESDAIVCFRCAGNALAILRRRDYLSGGAETAIPRLSGPPDPPEKRGSFAILRRGRPWDRQIYRL